MPTLLRASVIVEQAALVALPAVLLLLWLAARRRPAVEGTPDRAGDRITRAEIALLAVILAGALLLRVLWWDHGLPGTIFGGEIMTLRAHAAFRRGGLLGRWWQALGAPYNSSWVYDSPIVQPIVVAFQWLLGPRLHVIVFVGAFLGVGGVALTWLAGRLLHGPRFGLLLAGLLAVSPLQVVWSRLGYRAEIAVPHVLLAIALATLAGRRGSWLLALATGLVGYLSLHTYEAARTAIPLAFVALWAGTRTPVRHNGRFLVLSLVLVATVLVLASTIHHTTRPWRVIWPQYMTYAGNQGEEGLADLVAKNTGRVKMESRRSLYAYFAAGRSPAYPDKIAWGIQYGGLTFAPLALLGGIGILRALWSAPRYLTWFAMLVLGLALPSLGCFSARRLIVFDVAWCAFAAIGLASLARAPVLRRIGPRVRTALAVGFLAAMGVWTLAAIVILREAPLVRGLHQVAFSAGCLSDVIDCPRCLAVARRWEADIRRGDLVVFLDTDFWRESPTGPAGLPLFGYLAAAGAGAPDRFQELYPILWNINFLPEERVYRPPGADPAASLRDLLRSIPHRRIIWHSERPTAWDRWIADRLVAAGGRRSTFRTPLGDGPGFRVTTTKRQLAGVLHVVDSIAAAGPRDAGCVATTAVRAEPLPFVALALAVAKAPTDTALPTWFGLAWVAAAAAETTWPVHSGRHAVLDADGKATFVVPDGGIVTYERPGNQTSSRPATMPFPVGRHCAAFTAGRWWAVDPEHGVLKTVGPTPSIPDGAWIGVTSDGNDEIVLAAADQQIVVLDAATGAEKFRFPAAVTPSRAGEFGECAQIVRGRGWIAVLHEFANRLDVYADPGRLVGRVDLAHRGLVPAWAIAGVDAFLGVAHGTSITTLRLDLGRCGS